jgi:hypothetical protein
MNLEAACQRYGVPAFVKMDIEGSEVDVLASARDLLRGSPIHFALDTHHWVNGVRTTSAIEQIFRECDYETESSDASGFWTTWARPRPRKQKP